MGINYTSSPKQGALGWGLLAATLQAAEPYRGWGGNPGSGPLAAGTAGAHVHTEQAGMTVKTSITSLSASLSLCSVDSCLSQGFGPRSPMRTSPATVL